MNSIAYIVAALLLVTVIDASFIEESLPEDILLETKSDLSAMKKKGATEADCKDLAVNLCKEVYSDVSTAQKVINRQSSGSHCEKLGEKGYIAAKNEYGKVKTQWVKAKSTVLKLKNNTWKETLTYDALRPGKCGFIFSSKEYLTTHRLVNKAIRLERLLMGKITETRKWMITMLYRRNKARFNCRCAVLKARNAIWNRFKNRATQQKALSKCKMMTCVLTGTPVSSRKCRAVLPKLKNKVLTKIIEWSHKTGICRRKWLKEREHKTAERLAEQHRKAEKKSKIERQIKHNRERQAKRNLSTEKFGKARAACNIQKARTGIKRSPITTNSRDYTACQRAYGQAWCATGSAYTHVQNSAGGGYPGGSSYWNDCQLNCDPFFKQYGLVFNIHLDGRWTIPNKRL